MLRSWLSGYSRNVACQLSRSPGSIERRKICTVTLAQGTFLMSFFFSCILHAQPQTKCDGPHARCLGRFVVWLRSCSYYNRALTQWRRDCCMPIHDETRRYSLLSNCTSIFQLRSLTYSLAFDYIPLLHASLFTCLIFSSIAHKLVRRSSQSSAIKSTTTRHGFVRFCRKHHGYHVYRQSICQCLSRGDMESSGLSCFVP